MAAMKNLYQDVKEGRVTIDEASVILGAQNPDVEYTTEQMQVLELMAAEREMERTNPEYYDQLAQEAESEYYNKLADINDNGRIIDLGFINDL